MSAIACRMLRFKSLNKLKSGGKLGPWDYLYLVIWVDYPVEEATWQTWGQLLKCDAAKKELSDRIRTGRVLSKEQLLEHNGDAERIEEFIGKRTPKYLKSFFIIASFFYYSY